MSSARLKKRVAEDGSLQNNNLNESFVQYGTPLPSLADTKKDQGEYVPIWQQEVRDEQGRRRLHGAFTGGFSAGYYNTAGSKEGWTPSTFVSKKEAKGKQRAEQRPEDFMDEEDLAELKASRAFKTTESYGGGQARPQDAFAGLGAVASTSTSSANAQDPGYSAAVANSLKDLVKPGSRRIGQKIMTKMGWRPGQGIGPRVSYARRKEQMRELGMPVDEEDEEDEEAAKHTFAPLDRTVLTFEQKDNQWGIGYVPGQGITSRLQDQSSSQAGPSSYSIPVSDQARFGKLGRNGDAGPQTRMPVGGAFGISALEDADEDDLDVYGSGIPEGRNLVLNDDEDEEDGFAGAYGGSKKPQLMRWNDRQKKAPHARPPEENVSRQQQQTFNDGSPMLPGFVLASRLQPPDKWFPAEPVPKNWQPNPKAIWERERLKSSTSAAASTSNMMHPQRKGQQNMLTADDRGNILGEPTAPKSVFDFLSAKDKERIQSLGRGEAPTTNNAGPQIAGPAREPEVLRVPTIDPRVAQSALKGFMPYGDDPAKQARYKAFLTHHAMPQDASKPFQPSPPPGKTIGELNTELEAFANAAMIFKPMSGMMANRFTSSTGQAALLDIKAPEAGLYKPKPVSDAQKLTEQNEEEKKRKVQEEREAADPRRIAVREGNFGFMTRTVEPWYPTKLLCKRFNVADPHPDGPSRESNSSHSFGQTPSAAQESDILNQSAMDSMMQDRKSNNTGDGFLGGVSFPSAQPGAQATAAAEANDPAMDGTAQADDVLAYEKPSMDIFKAIFASDDEDDMDEDEEAIKQTPSTASSQPEMAVDDPSAIPDTTIFDTKAAEPPAPLKIEDLSTFKPTFVSRTDRITSSKDEAKKKDKDKKKKKKASAIVSFDIEDGEEESASATKDSETSSKKRKSGSKEKDGKSSKKERKTSSSPQDMAEEDEWVEKEPAVPAVTATSNGKDEEAPRRNARVTASELF
ncbi:hypothetical protein P389DRAFT_103559 [Cystobasidium minutum MCA 4210]|uniref:uncharacterized protein n=1 Tax=Cystobasidium minutum MCA 4210 TaxID=1397322 RepID=UPI0034CD8123|eukprot:jgi/Rhomi1/103559/CE103558_1311